MVVVKNINFDTTITDFATFKARKVQFEFFNILLK